MRVGTVAFFLLIHFLWLQITDYNHRFLVLSSSLLFFSLNRRAHVRPITDGDGESIGPTVTSSGGLEGIYYDVDGRRRSKRTSRGSSGFTPYFPFPFPTSIPTSISAPTASNPNFRTSLAPLILVLAWCLVPFLITGCTMNTYVSLLDSCIYIQIHPTLSIYPVLFLLLNF